MITVQRIHLLPQLFVIFVLNRSHMLYMLPLCVQKCLNLRQNINTLSSYCKLLIPQQNKK